MISLGKIIGIVMVFFLATLAWMGLGGVMTARSDRMGREMEGNVSELWGTAQAQRAPSFTHAWNVEVEESRTEQEEGKTRIVKQKVIRTESRQVSPNSTTIRADLKLDQRLKGLMWYSLYALDFDGSWTYTHEGVPGTLQLAFQFPDPSGLYDAFRFVVDGVDRARELRPENGNVALNLPVQPGQRISLDIGYKTRGMDLWKYLPADGVANLENFSLTMTTDFGAIDYPAYALSPSNRVAQGSGWKLDWTFKQLVTGHAIGMVTPTPIQPGELAAELSFSAPVSLLFFFLILFVLATLKGIDIHPINYLFLAGAFFAFHLLFAYSVDHITIVPAFILCSVVSVVLVVSYLRLVVSNRFAFVEAALAQSVYLIVFSLAHFWDGYTGLTVTVLSILTLFVLMQLTGRIRWSEVVGGRGKLVAPIPEPASL